MESRKIQDPNVLSQGDNMANIRTGRLFSPGNAGVLIRVFELGAVLDYNGPIPEMGWGGRLSSIAD